MEAYNAKEELNLHKYKEVYMVFVKPKTSHVQVIEETAVVIPLGEGEHTHLTIRSKEKEFIIGNIEKFSHYPVTALVESVEFHNTGKEENVAFMILEDTLTEENEE